MIAELEKLPPGTAVCVGEMDQSVRTHLKNGRIADVDPLLYMAWTVSVGGSRTRALIFVVRKT